MPKEEEKLEIAASIPTERKIPAFWKSEPELWFCRVEASFSRASITNSVTKFEIIIPCLEFDVLKQVADIVKQPSGTPYEDLKQRLITTYAESETRRIQRLLEGKTLGEDKPSHFLRSMRQLAGETVSDDIIKTLWMRSLPSNTQAILIATSHTDLNKLAEVADKIHDLQDTPQVSAVTTSKTNSLEEKVEQLTQQVAALVSDREFHRRSSSRGASRSRHRSSSTHRNRPKKENWLCFYHYKFKDKARKCIKPCAWAAENGQTSEN